MSWQVSVYLQGGTENGNEQSFAESGVVKGVTNFWLQQGKLRKVSEAPCVSKIIGTPSVVFFDFDIPHQHPFSKWQHSNTNQHKTVRTRQ